MKTLPNARQIQVDREKIVNYLLCMGHPDGQSKARFFMRFGFSLERWAALADALCDHGKGNAVVNVVKSRYGVRYIVEGDLVSPDGRHPRVRTVWIIGNSETVPRLITAHPI